MSLSQFVLRIANQRVLAPGVRLANTVLKPRRPRAVRVMGHTVYAASFDRLAALWMRKWSSSGRFEARVWTELLQPGMVVADVGANVGVYALLAAERVGAAGRVYAFEPDPDNFALLEKNIAVNGYERIVTAHQAAVADRAGRLTLYRRPEHHGDHRIYQPAGAVREGVEVPVTTLDALLSEVSRLDVVKLDIQGAEWLALQGMSAAIAANPRMAILSEFWPEGLTQCGADPRAFLEAWSALGFEIQEIDDDQGCLRPTGNDQLLERCRRVRFTNLLLTRS